MNWIVWYAKKGYINSLHLPILTGEILVYQQCFKNFSKLLLLYTASAGQLYFFVCILLVFLTFVHTRPILLVYYCIATFHLFVRPFPLFSFFSVTFHVKYFPPITLLNNQLNAAEGGNKKIFVICSKVNSKSPKSHSNITLQVVFLLEYKITLQVIFAEYSC